MSPSDSDDGARLHIGEIATVSEGVVTKFDVFEAYALRYENMVDECAEISQRRCKGDVLNARLTSSQCQ